MNKLWLLLALAVTLSVFDLSPFQTTDLSRLSPVQTMVITGEAGALRVDCGEGLSGRGADLAEALADLKAGAEGTVFLGTAQDIVLCADPQVWGQLTQIPELRPAAELYQSAESVAPGDVQGFLQQHQSGVTLLDLRIGLLYEEAVAVPSLRQEEGGYRLVNGKPL